MQASTLVSIRCAAGFLAVCSFPVAPSLLLAESRLEARAVLSQVSAADSRREADVRKVVSTRRYVLRNKRWPNDAIMSVRIVSDIQKGKSFEIVSFEHTEGLQKKIFQKLLEAEMEAARKQSVENDSEIDSTNYDFAILGSENFNGRACLVVELKPKRNSKYLIARKAWIDPAENAIVHVEGKTARNVSFWIGKPHVTQSFRKVDNVWVAAENRSVSDVKLLGRTELTIEFREYDIVRAGALAQERAAVASRAN